MFEIDKSESFQLNLDATDMGSNDPLPFNPQSPFPNDIDAIRQWEQFPMGNEQSESNFQFDHAPPFKRPKTSNDDFQTSAAYQPMNHPRMPRPNPPINPPGKIFFKTRLCAKFRMGQCRNGENCNFAHGEEDMRQPPPNWQNLVSGRVDDRGGSGGNWEDDDKIIHRMKLCKKFYNGEECPYGERCNFLHKEPPKQRGSSPGLVRIRENQRESSAISIGTSRPPVVQQTSGSEQFSANQVVAVEPAFDALRGNMKPVYWKTRICSKWELTGHCPFGESCHFAHGHTDMQFNGARAGEPDLANLISSTQKPFIPGPVKEAAPTKAETVKTASNQEGHQGKKCIFKWNANKKINSIYADWIDDMPLNFPNEVES